MKQTLKIGMVYYLDSAPKDEWAADLAKIREAGSDYVLIGDMLTLHETLREDHDYLGEALDLCAKNGLQAILEVFHSGLMKEQLPLHFMGEEIMSIRFYAYRMSFRRYQGEEDFFEYVSIYNEILHFFNVMSQNWREKWLFPYLEAIAQNYSHHPALAGYQFSDVLATPEVVSYGAEDARRFREWCSRKYGELSSLNSAWGEAYSSWEEVEPPRLIGRWSRAWNDWVQARREWLTEWAHQTTSFLRQQDKNPNHLLILKDKRSSFIDRDLTGGYTPTTIAPFDAVLIDVFRPYDEIASQDLLVYTQRDVEMLRDLCGEKEIGWVAWAGCQCQRPNVERLFPQAKQVIQVAEVALSTGTSHLQYYAYRRPIFPGDVFPVTQTLYYHPEVMSELARFHQQKKKEGMAK